MIFISQIKTYAAIDSITIVHKYKCVRNIEFQQYNTNVSG